jgi:tRNA(His) 5'-end guanylyltransferase
MPTPGDSLGDRIKRYEAVSRPFLAPNIPVMIRVDGKAFHTWARHMQKPFDMGIVTSMREAAVLTSEHMQGFQLAYTQSDEASFLITDTDSHEQEGWFGYNLNKIVSVTASTFTLYFNNAAREYIAPAVAPAFFDARAFSVPEADVPNAFLWRQRDWERNSLMMYARHFLSHGKLQNKKRDQVHELLHEYGANWATDLEPVLKNGTWIGPDGGCSHEKLDYYGIQSLIGTPSV